MLKDVVVVVDGAGERATPCAIALAADLGASLSAVSVLPLLPFGTYACADVSYDLIASARSTARAQAGAVAESVARAARDEGLSCETAVICEEARAATERLVAWTRTADLVVIEQADPERPKPADAHLDTVLLTSGRPTLVVPYIQARPPALTSAIVAWDGSATAARALGDALPLLQRAHRVEAVTVAAEPPSAEMRRCLIRHLARHGIDAGFQVLPATLPVAEALLSHAADRSADLLVMGAYGHSHLREAILGGASRSMLRSMTLPVLMSH
ncbi:universal stress protein [Methylobacterium sp. ID0610]|uniref:universal stress protein n=1 Tax=Methylobacterium carpenticola TaxID=3344827 RepID=UPI00369062B5